MASEKEVTWNTDKYHYIHEREKGKTETVVMSDEQALHERAFLLRC